MNTTEHNKLKSTLRNKLESYAQIDKKYYLCLIAFDLAARIHTGKRKDGKTPEFDHMLNMLAFSLSIHDMLSDPCSVYIIILLHDAYEDYPEYIDSVLFSKSTGEAYVNLEELLLAEFSENFNSLLLISKVVHTPDSQGGFTTVKKTPVEYYDEMSKCPNVSISKGIDRHHNLSTMVGVFKIEKQRRYVNDVYIDFLPMLKTARKLFPEQRNAYELLKSILNIHCNTIKSFISEIENLQK